MTTPQLHEPIYPCIWFDNDAKQAAELYCSVFNDTHIVADTPMVVTMTAGEQKFMFLNGGPVFKPNPSISLFVTCETGEEVDRIWKGLSEGGHALMALDAYPWSKKYGWLADRFGVSWQIMLGSVNEAGGRFSPSLMFTRDRSGEAGAAINFYGSVFSPSRVNAISRYEAGEGDVEGYIKHSRFTLGETVITAMDSSGPHQFTFNEGVSLVVECDNQEEIDYYWERLTEGGSESQCGWLKDQFGVSWQIIPSLLSRLMRHPEKAGKVMQAVMKMKKFDLAELERTAQ